MKKRLQNIDLYPIKEGERLPLPLAEEIRAGFPSPAQDYMDLSIDLNQELIQNPSSTFFGRVRGNSMIDAYVEDGDVLIIDKSLEPEEGDMIVCVLNGEFTLKYFHRDKKQGLIVLVPANPSFPKIHVTPEMDFRVWGVATYTIKNNRVRKNRKI